MAAEVAAVHAEMEKVGRDPAELVVSMLWAFLGAEGAEQIIDAVGRYAEAGLHHLVGIPWVGSDRWRPVVGVRPADRHPRQHGPLRRRGATGRPSVEPGSWWKRFGDGSGPASNILHAQCPVTG